MNDLPIPESGGESLVLGLVVVAMLALYLLVRRTHRRADEEYWERRKTRRQVQEEPRPAVPLDAWSRGDRVWVVDGPYELMKGEIAEIRGTDAILVVTVDVYGTPTRVELRPEQVDRAR